MSNPVDWLASSKKQAPAYPWRLAFLRRDLLRFRGAALRRLMRLVGQDRPKVLGNEATIYARMTGKEQFRKRVDSVNAVLVRSDWMPRSHFVGCATRAKENLEEVCARF